MNVLIVRAHHEPKSFSNALADQAAKTLGELGHSVVVSDLYASNFDPVSDRRNFTSIKNADYLKQQIEEAHASEVNGFVPDLDAEMRKLEAADLLIFSFPIWWSGMPAILKGWVDRVVASGRIYGGAKRYENGLGKAQKRALVLMTTGSGPDVYGGFGVNPPLTTLLAPVRRTTALSIGASRVHQFESWIFSPIRPKQGITRMSWWFISCSRLFLHRTRLESQRAARHPDFSHAHRGVVLCRRVWNVLVRRLRAFYMAPLRHRVIPKAKSF
jgi:NAD(P)H dehydrogenase (quinone)